MIRTSILLALALATVALPASAQRSQGLCDGDTVTTVDDVNCVRMNFRMWARQDTEGLEEDAIIGVGTADVTLDRADLAALATTRIGLAPAPGAGKYHFVDWVAFIKTQSDGAPYGTGGGRVGVGVGVANASGGLWTVRPPIYAQAVSAVSGGGGNPGGWRNHRAIWPERVRERRGNHREHANHRRRTRRPS